LTGPTKTHGIAAVKTLVALSLGEEFPGLSGQHMRARELVIEPGAVVAVHRHEKRPGFALILEGEMVEHRNDQKGAITRRVGDIAVERTGVSHWWENQSGKRARALVVDIVPTPR
jgi:quercetin dioxygenase-like cupin family protein